MAPDTINDPPARSPDNRYIVADMGDYTILYDMRDRSSRIIAKGWGKPHFAWTPDSKHIYFPLSGTLIRYDLEDEKKTKLNFEVLRGWFFPDSQRYSNANEYRERL